MFKKALERALKKYIFPSFLEFIEKILLIKLHFIQKQQIRGEGEDNINGRKEGKIYFLSALSKAFLNTSQAHINTNKIYIYNKSIAL